MDIIYLKVLYQHIAMVVQGKGDKAQRQKAETIWQNSKGRRKRLKGAKGRKNRIYFI
jgi:hypothetical protein